MQIKTALRKPTKVKCIQFTGDNFKDIKEFCGSSCNQYLFYDVFDCSHLRITIKTLQGDVIVNKGDYVLKGEDFYPIREDLFHKLYTLED